MRTSLLDSQEMFCLPCTMLRIIIIIKNHYALGKLLLLQIRAVAYLPIKMGLLLVSYYVVCSDLGSKTKCLFLLSLVDIAAWMNFSMGLLGNSFEGGCGV